MYRMNKSDQLLLNTTDQKEAKDLNAGLRQGYV